MYQDDFAAPDAVYAPAGEGLMLGLPPLLLFMLLLLFAAVAALAWWMGRNSVSGPSGDDAAPAEIHRAILAASSAAMAASSNELKARAQALRDLIADLLGPVLDVAKGVTPPLKALDEALKGEKKVDAKATAAPPPAAASHPKPACGCGKPEACTCPTGGPVTVNQVYIGGVAVAPPASCGCAGAHKADCTHAGVASKPEPQPVPKPETQAMTGPEQIEALAKAVRQFHDHWLDGPARIRELKAARTALSRRPPTPRVKPHGSGH
jgi:hypothetical protein